MILRLKFNTPNWNTPKKNLDQNRLFEGIHFIVGEQGIAERVCSNFLGKFWDDCPSGIDGNFMGSKRNGVFSTLFLEY